jgi:hypothetical protein
MPRRLPVQGSSSSHFRDDVSEWIYAQALKAAKVKRRLHLIAEILDTWE